MIKPGGQLIVSVPVGPSCIVFNAHRIFHRDEFLSYLPHYTVLDEIYLAPEPSPPEAITSLSVGEFMIYVVHLRKVVD